nr:transposase [Carnobacterium funditum]
MLVRGDSGCATPELYEICEVYDSIFVVRLKVNCNRSRLAKGFIQIDNNHLWNKKSRFFDILPSKKVDEGMLKLY